MKKYLLWLPVVLLVMLAAMNSTEKDNAGSQTGTNKSISFAVYKGNNYISDAYNNTSASLQITIEKVRGNQRIKVWEKTFDAKLLKQYPSPENALSQKVFVPNVLDKKEHLEVTYTLTYDSEGSKLKMQNDSVVSCGSAGELLNISI